MSIFRSKSFYYFVLSGLGLVALPLVVVLVSSDVLMGRLATHSSTSVYHSVLSAQLSQKLVEKVTNQERKVRQYLVLGDAQLNDDVVFLYQEILETLLGLEGLAQQGAQKGRISRLKALEAEIVTLYKSARDDAEKAKQLIDIFAEQNSMVNDVYYYNNEATYKEVEKLQAEASHARSVLLVLASVLLPITIVLIGFLARLITRPINQIDQGINQLGGGDFSSPITISGPDDLIFLGKRLDWLRKKLIRYEKDKNKFAAHISHELKTPLASIYEGSELLCDEIVGSVNENQREVLEIMRKNCFQLQQLIENLVSYTMAQVQKTSLTLSQFDISELIHQCLVNYKPAIMKNHLKVVASIGSFDIVADRNRIKTVIDNLLSNAVKNSPVHGELSISASRGNNVWQFMVADSGQGIAASDRDFIFSPFYQGRSAGHTHIKGTGLGLAIAFEYVSAHGGSIELVDSQLPGACFKIILPMEDYTEV
jgi:two-component system sensor histidine kinase GlrK